MSSSLRFLVLFGYLLGWRILGSIEISHIIAICAIGIYGTNRRESGVFISFLFPALVYVFVAMYVSIFLWGSPDASMLLTLLRLMVMFMGAFAVVKMFKSKTQLYVSIIHVFNVHSILMIIMFISPQIRDAIYDMTGARSIVNNVYTFNEGYRISGLTYGLAITSIIHASILILLKYVTNARLVLVTVLLNISAILISGRSGIVVLGLICIFFFNYKSLKSWLILLILIGVTLTFSATLNHDIPFINWLEYSLSEFKSISNTGSSTTLDYLNDMFFFPDFPIVLFGYMNTSRFLFGSYLDIDMGVVRWIWSFGLLGSFFLYLPYASMVIYSVIRKYDVAMFFLLFIFFLAHFKEEVLYSRVNIYLVFIIYAANFYRKKLG